VLQGEVLDRPVIDQTGIKGRWDFTLKWTPDGPVQPGAAQLQPREDAPPDLFTAIQEQLGLKLVATKTLVDVLIIDHVGHPSEN
jgi:uncharacterized protein (TIGR03435 family)